MGDQEMDTIKKISVIFILLTFSSFFPSATALSVGVKAGHRAKYKVESVSFGYQYAYFELSISSVSGTIVKGTVTYEYPYGSLPTTMSFEYDISTGAGFTALPYCIIPANLKVGDTIFSGGVLKIDGMETRSYAGASRKVVWSGSYTGKFYWDQETGILVEETIGGVTMFKLNETNIWGGGIFDVTSPMFWILIIAIIVAVIVVVLIVMRLLRKKKTSPRAVAKPVKENKIENIKYCVRCGASMPQEATFCPKCGHEQPRK
jgi:ribosomal protein L40E